MLDELKQHPSLAFTQDIIDLCKPLALFNITTFANARFHQNKTFSSLCTNPNFFRNYLEKGYQHHDIHVHKNNAIIDGCYMWDFMECFGKTEDMLNDARSFDNKHIFTMIRSHETHTDLYHFGTHLQAPWINQWYVNHIDLLNHFIDHFENKLSQAANLLKAHKILFPIRSESAICQIKSISDHLHDDKNKRMHFLKELEHNAAMLLSPRQLECAFLLVQGYSAKRIAKQLNISYRTVEEHLRILKKKLQAKNNFDLFTKISRILPSVLK